MGAAVRVDGMRLNGGRRRGLRYALVLPRLDKKADNGLFSERLGGLQAVQALD